MLTTAARAIALAGALAVANAVAPTRVSVSQSCQGAVKDWAIRAPSHTTANLPDFNLSVSSPSFKSTGPLLWEASGSLGLPKHPLGILAFSANGSACGESTMYIYDGVLGQAALTFPPCAPSPATAAAAGFALSAHVQVWTVIPAVPPLISTGFGISLKLRDASSGSVLLCLEIALAEPPQSGAEPSQDSCQMDAPAAPPPAEPLPAIPTLTVDLDAPAATRWEHVVAPRKEKIVKLVDAFLASLAGQSSRINNTLVNLLLNGAAVLEMARMPPQFVHEMKGIARVTGVAVGYIWVLNMMYELTGLCTSVVAQAEDGTMWHGRNLDFGIFMGTSPVTHNWSLTQLLRDILVDIQFVRGGEVLYNATTYAGFVGLLSGSKAGSYSVSVDTRYDATLDAGVIGWLLGENDDCQFLTFQTRLVMESTPGYDAALASFVDYKPLGPAYVIVAGAKPGQGAVVAKKFNSTAERDGKPWPNEDVWLLEESLAKGSFYVLETNYDRLHAPPGFDDRRYPAENCLREMGQGKIGRDSMRALMSTNPTRNALTTFTNVMSPTTGHYETFQQYCAPGPHCAPF